MPVSHLSLTVSNLRAATEFYCNALAPLGYRMLGKQGPSVGLGIEDADFFLCPALGRTNITPSHIAFSADSPSIVRDTYAAALNSGGRPSGAPDYRAGDCGCFNAAVLDPDLHTIEFIYRPASETEKGSVAPALSVVSRDHKLQSSSARSGYTEAAPSLASKVSRAKSRGQTLVDLASTTSKSTRKSEVQPTPGITRSRTEPIPSDDSSKVFMRNILGAAATAAVAYAAFQSSLDNSREEAEFARSNASMRSNRTRSHYDTSGAPQNSGRSSQPQRQKTLAIEQPRYFSEIQDALSGMPSSRRPAPPRSRTVDEYDYIDASTASRRDDRYRMKRSITQPVRLLEDQAVESRKAPSSRHTLRRGSADDTNLDLKRHDSGISMHSHRSRRSFDGGRRSSTSNVSTIRPSRRNSQYKDSAADVPLPSSRTQSFVTADQVSLPPSRTTTYMSAARMPLPRSQASGGYAMNPTEEYDGMDDNDTVVPDDSISRVGSSSKSRRDQSSSKSSRHSSKRSEATTVRPAKPSSKYSALTVPVRSKEDYPRSREGRRSTHTYA